MLSLKQEASKHKLSSRWSQKVTNFEKSFQKAQSPGHKLQNSIRAQKVYIYIFNKLTSTSGQVSTGKKYKQEHVHLDQQAMYVNRDEMLKIWRSTDRTTCFQLSN